MSKIENFKLDTPIGPIAGIKNLHQTGRVTCIALHGWLDNAASFIPLIQQLPQFNWIAVDLPGHGHSVHRPPHSHYHFIDWISDLNMIVEEIHKATFFSDIDSENLVLIGHSMGGLIANAYAAIYPEQFGKLITIDAAGLYAEADEHGVKDIRNALDSRARSVLKPSRIHQSKQSAVLARLKAGDLSEASSELLVARNLIETEAGFEWRTDNRLKTLSPLRFSSKTAHKLIAAIKLPTLICLAQNGHESVKHNLQRYKPDYADLSISIVDGGHHCHMDNPEATANGIVGFLS